jgi:hypothetical protein
MYEIGTLVCVNDKMQQGYSYEITAPEGAEYAEDFHPHFTPQEMLKLGVFEGKYCNDCQNELPSEWFEQARISETANPSMNYFKIKSRQPLYVWREKEWIIPPDPRGWFQWYCRYYLGRRIEGVDAFQIKRWKAFARHAGQIKANCAVGDLECRPRQRQALLQWSYDPFI